LYLVTYLYYDLTTYNIYYQTKEVVYVN